MVNFYRPFLAQAAQKQLPLQLLLGKCVKSDRTPLNWTPDAEEAFITCKTDLRNATFLSHPNFKAKIAVMSDASDTAVGASLQQQVAGNWQPLGFFSRKLSDTERKYSTYDRELLAIFTAVKHFQHILEGANFIVFTDHKPLTFAFSQKSEKLSPRQLNHLGFIAQFTTDVRHIGGLENVVADAFSRIDNIGRSVPIDFGAWAEGQQSDKQLESLLKGVTGLKLQKIRMPNSEMQLYCDTSTQNIRPYVPEPFRRTIFNNLHGLAHSGVKSTTRLIVNRFVWPSMKRDIARWTKCCIACQRSKVSRHVKAPLSNFAVPSRRFAHVNIDIIGPMPSSHGFRYCLTCVDRCSRWPEAFPVEDIRAETIATAFYSGWISRFGVPGNVTTDRGRQFDSELFRSLAKLFGIQLSKTSAYHPQANGLVERWHRTVKSAIMCHTSSDWVDALPAVLLGLRTVFKEDIGCSAAEMVYGTDLRLPGQFFEDVHTETCENEFVTKLKKHFEKLKPTPTSTHGSKSVFLFKDLHSCSHVFVRVDAVRPSLQPPYTGPYEVISRNFKTFELLIGSRKDYVSIDRVKPAHILNTDYVNSPPHMSAVHCRPPLTSVVRRVRFEENFPENFVSSGGG